ncbi:Transcription factor Dp-2 [Entomortierella lignicola]|nr:Transcription factor Dp-2 [Entomortierella lignicola]
MTPSDKLPNQQQHPRQHPNSLTYHPSPNYSHPNSPPQQQQQQQQQPPPPLRHSEYSDHYHHRPQIPVSTHSPTSYPASDSQYQQNNLSPTTRRPQSTDYPHRDPQLVANNSEGVRCSPISPQRHPHEQPHHDQQWQRQQQQQQSPYSYDESSPTRFSRNPQPFVTTPYDEYNRTMASRSSNREHANQPYSHFPPQQPQQFNSEQRSSPQSLSNPQYSHESSSWNRHGSAASYHQDQPIDHPVQEIYTHQSRTERHYVLTSVGPTPSYTQQRSSIALSASCSSLETTSLVQALPSIASASGISPQSPSSPTMMHAPPLHGSGGGDRLFMPDRSLDKIDQKPPQRNLPAIPRIRTQWSKDSARELPPLSFTSSSSYSTSRSGDGKMSPTTPRTSIIPVTSTLGESYPGYELPKPVYHALLDNSSKLGNFVSESPVDYRHARPYRDDHEMEHCSEQDDVREREHEDDDDDDDEDEEENQRSRKVARHSQATDSKSKFAANNDNDLEGEYSESGNCTFGSSSGRRLSPTISPSRDGPKKKSSRSKTVPSLSPEVQRMIAEAVPFYEDEGQGQDEIGAQPLNGKGLGHYAPLVCARVAARGVATYNDLVNDLAGGQQPIERVDGGVTQEKSGQGNIRRRVYDALNILEALGIITMNKKTIRWIGIENSRPIAELSRRILPPDPLLPQNGFQQQERDGSDESEEPEDDEMDIGIAKLQEEIEAMKIRNELEMAQLQDQVARGVRLNNLIERNKRKEEKELERQLRRRQKKHERREEKRAQAAAAGGESMEVGDESGDAVELQKKRSERRHHRHHRHRSPRAENEDQEEEDESNQDGARPGEDVDEETARRIRKQERKEKRERKERRAQRRAKEAAEGDVERIQLPFVIVKLPKYVSQSSDSESSISMVHRMREEPRSRKGGRSRRHLEDETTMVDITMPHNEELNIISDTEIVGELGLNDVPLEELKAMLTQEAFDDAEYATRATGEFGENIIATVKGGFERAIVCSSGNL